MFFWNSLAFSMTQQMLAIWSLVPLHFLRLAWTSGSSQFMYYWNLTWRILNITCCVCSSSLIWARLFATPWTVAHQPPLSMEFSRQEYWSGLPCPTPGNLPNLGTEPGSPALQADSLPIELWGKTITFLVCEMSTLVSSLNILCQCLSLRLEWNWHFPVLWPLLSFQNFLSYGV